MPLKVAVGIVMGSDSDLEVMRGAGTVLDELEVGWEMRIISAHRRPDDAAAYAQEAGARGLGVLVAGAGLAAHLPGVLASHTVLPVVGVPLAAGALQGQDALYSIVQMPPGVPVATVGIGAARNAGLLAAQILATGDEMLGHRLAQAREEQARKLRGRDRRLTELGADGYLQERREARP